MTDTAPTAAREPRRGREARRTARAHRSHASVPYITRKIPLTETLSEEGLETIERNAETLLQEIGIEFRDFPRALDLFRNAGCDIKGERVRFPRGLARQLCATTPAQYVQHARNPERNVLDRRRRDGVRPQLRLAVRPRPRQGPPLRDARRLPEFRQARLHEPLYPPFRRHGVRAGRPARQQAAFRDGVCASQIFGQAVHGLGDQARAGRGQRAHLRASVRRGFRARQHGADEPHQRQFAAGLGFEHARRRGGLCAQQPGLHHHPVHSVRRDEPGDGRRHPDPGAGRSAWPEPRSASSPAPARRWCSEPSSRRSPCSRAPRPSARPRRRWRSSAPASSRGG